MRSKEDISHYWNEIRQKKFRNYPYQMSNKELAGELFEKVKDEYPNAVMIETGNKQWILTNKYAKGIMISWLDDQVRNLEREISERKEIIEKLKK